jgi:hypothetical protein
MTTTWQQELRGLLDTVPGGAERLIRAIDEGRMDPHRYTGQEECGTVGCVYGHVYGAEWSANNAKQLEWHRQGHKWSERLGTCGLLTVYGRTALEMELTDNPNAIAIRAETLVWLAEHGSAPTGKPSVPPLVSVPEEHSTTKAE